jgi:hypothetical protein
MPALSRCQENTPSILNWFVTVGGVLTDVYEIGYQIFDISTGLPGTQIFPIIPGEWENVTSAPGNFNIGSHYAYDNTADTGYTPLITENIGTHRIYWRWKINIAAPYQLGAEDFEVLSQSSGSSIDTYIAIQDVRDAGLTDLALYPDSAVLSSIELWQSVLDRTCRQWFVPKIVVLKIDGTDSDTLHFGVPIISVEYMKINNSETPLDIGLYKAYTAITYPDDRRNPRIKLIRSDDVRDIYTAPISYGQLIFRKGRGNQEIKCTLGYVEEDMSVPKPIQRALLKLVIEKITAPYLSGTTAIQPPPIIGALLEEETDGHRIKYAQSGAPVSSRSPYMTGITNDQEIIEIIKMFRAPIGCATPAHSSYR